MKHLVALNIYNISAVVQPQTYSIIVMCYNAAVLTAFFALAHAVENSRCSHMYVFVVPHRVFGSKAVHCVFVRLLKMCFQKKQLTELSKLTYNMVI